MRVPLSAVLRPVIRWRREEVADNKGKPTTEYVSADGTLRIGTGYDEVARRERGEAYVVLRRDPARRGGWRILDGTYRSLDEAKGAAREVPS